MMVDGLGKQSVPICASASFKQVTSQVTAELIDQLLGFLIDQMVG